MADAELQILIKARNDAKKEFDSLNNQIKQLNGTSTTGLTGTANKLKQFGSTMNTVSTQMTGLNLSTLAGVAGIGALTKMYKGAIDSTMEYAYQVRTLSRDIGGTPEDISKLIQAADDAQVSFETLKNSLVIANKQGVDVTVEGMMILADQYNAIQDPLARLKFLTDTFGRSGEQMGAFMQLGANGIKAAGEEAEKYGRVLSESAIAQTEQFRIAQDNLDDSMARLKDTMALEVMPALTTMLNSVSPVINAYNTMKSTLDSLDPALKGIITTLYSFLDPIKAIMGPLVALINAFKQLLALAKSAKGIQPPSMGGYTSAQVAQNYGYTGYTAPTSGAGTGNYAGSGGLEKASGGPVSASTPYIVGEVGPELFIPSQSGNIVPNNKLGGNTVIVNHTYSPAVSLSDRTEAETKLVPFIQAALARVA